MPSDYSEEGDERLAITSKQTKFTSWMFEEIKPWVTGHVLEVGSGKGTYTKYLKKVDPQMVLTDVDEEYVKALKKKYKKNDSFVFDISNQEHANKIKKHHLFDTIVFLNVLEHVKDDKRALKVLKTLLKPGGRIVCLVPTHKWLFNTLDEAVYHHRRYTKKELREKVERAGYEVEKLFSFNVFAIPGWFINGTIFRKRVVHKGAMGLFNKLVPVFKFIEHHILFRKIGISTIIIAKK